MENQVGVEFIGTGFLGSGSNSDSRVSVLPNVEILAPSELFFYLIGVGDGVVNLFIPSFSIFTHKWKLIY